MLPGRLVEFVLDGVGYGASADPEDVAGDVCRPDDLEDSAGSYE
jgi:hypothetical protein